MSCPMSCPTCRSKRLKMKDPRAKILERLVDGPPAPKPIRYAIYTRQSVEKLADFSSCQAQFDIGQNSQTLTAQSVCGFTMSIGKGLVRGSSPLSAGIDGTPRCHQPRRSDCLDRDTEVRAHNDRSAAPSRDHRLARGPSCAHARGPRHPAVTPRFAARVRA